MKEYIPKPSVYGNKVYTYNYDFTLSDDKFEEMNKEIKEYDENLIISFNK